MADSRLSGGKYWDYGPKVFSAGRSDALIAFAGHTAWAYPLVLQTTSYVESFINLRDRAIDLSAAFTLILDLLNESLRFVTAPAHPSEARPECCFLFAGYSSRRKDFFIRRIVFCKDTERFESRPSRSLGGEYIAHIGDSAPASEFSRKVHQPRNGPGVRARLGMEPAVAFYEILASNKFTEVGGAPQVSKVYQHGGQRHFGVYWPSDRATGEQRIFLRGRQLGTFDVLDHPWVYDPLVTRLYWHDFSPDERRTLGQIDGAA